MINDNDLIHVMFIYFYRLRRNLEEQESITSTFYMDITLN